MGEITVLPHHIPLIATLVSGEIKYKHGSTDEFFAVSGGILEVKNNGEVVVLADTAEFGHEIDVQRAEEAKEAALKLVSEASKHGKSYTDASAMVHKQLVRLNVARKHHTRKGTRVNSNQ